MRKYKDNEISTDDYIEKMSHYFKDFNKKYIYMLYYTYRYTVKTR